MASGKLLRFFGKPLKNKKKHPTQTPKPTPWQDTGRVFYLLDTLKLSYEGERGLVTLERVDIDTLEELLQDISQPQAGHFRRRTTAGQSLAVHLSVCGVTWQEYGDQQRIKAIADAAVLRTKDPQLIDTQAIFKHADLSYDDAKAAVSTPLTTPGAFVYSRITPRQFIDRLLSANSALLPRYRNSITLRRQNFEQLFSSYEQQVLLQQANIKVS